MPSNFESAFATVQKLARDFALSEAAHLEPSYSEAAVRADYINPLFEALGWDVTHTYQRNPYAQEVKVERNVEVVGAAQKKADYAFHIAPNFDRVVFFVEAKKPQGNIDTADNYFQAIRYGWNSSNVLSVLTSFEQLHVLDCRYAPDINRTASRLLQKFDYRDYLEAEKFAKLYYLLSRDAVANGSIETYAASLPRIASRKYRRGLFKGGYQPVDESFLADLEEYRESLAKSFKSKNRELSGEALTEITQRVLDRLVFTRFLEDKLIEPNPLVAKLGERGQESWEEFSKSAALNRLYNGVVYKPHPILDAPGFEVDSLVFKRICDDISDPTSPYAFAYIPVEVLGSIYERFLGKIIIATDQRARVEEKPEIRKAGGVYYTPDYIVRYIVDNTLARLITDKTPADIAQMRFADISCGSGSFLVAIYDRLLKFHGSYYNAHRNEGEGATTIRDGKRYLTLRTKREILLNNIFGVDIDRQAVEVAQLSLYLKLLEDETTASAREHQREFHQALLPSLDRNVVSGNSLIAPDILQGQLFDAADERAINAMDFNEAFPSAMTQGGFDAVVGNPPYGAELSTSAREYLAERFDLGITDTAALFIAQQQNILKESGLGGFIVPKPFIYNSNWRAVRDKIRGDLIEIVDTSKVWPEVKLEQVIYLCRKGAHSAKYSSKVRHGREIVDIGEVDKRLIDDFGFLISGVSKREIQLATRLRSEYSTLGNVVSNQRGAMLQADLRAKGDLKVVGGKQITRYGDLSSTKGYVLKSGVTDEKAFIKDNAVLAQNIIAHIQNPTDHIQIIATVPNARTKIRCVLLDTVNQLEVRKPYSAYFVLGLVSSKIVNWYVYRFIFAKAIRTMHFDGPVTNRIPFPELDLTHPTNRKRHDIVVALVRSIMATVLDQAAAVTESSQEYLARKQSALELQLDREIGALFAMKADEIDLVTSSFYAAPSSKESRTASGNRARIELTS